MSFAVRWARLFRIGLLVCVIPAALWSVGHTKAATVVTPHAALVDIHPNGEVTLMIELHGAAEVQTILTLPAGASAQPVDSDQMGRLLERYVVPFETSEILEFNGVLDATQIPTMTPYLRATPAAGTVNQVGTLVNLPAVSSGAVYTLAVVCPQCANAWYVAVLAQLPQYAPVIILGNGVADCVGMWRVRAARDGDLGAGMPTRVVSLLTIKDAGMVGGCATSAAQSADVAVPVRIVTADGTQTLLRLVLCLVGVLLLSVASFYGALALTKRMHSAVGFRRENP
jgi:hypothetical protein